MRAERAAFALSVGLSWPRVKRLLSARAGSGSGNVLSRKTSSTTMGSRLVSAYGGQAGGEQQKTIARRLTHEEITHTSTPCAAPAAQDAPATPAAALVEDQPSGSTHAPSGFLCVNDIELFFKKQLISRGAVNTSTNAVASAFASKPQLPSGQKSIIRPSSHSDNASVATSVSRSPGQKFVSIVTVTRTRHVPLAAKRRGRLPQLQELHPHAGDRDVGPLRPRRTRSTTS